MIEEPPTFGADNDHGGDDDLGPERQRRRLHLEANPPIFLASAPASSSSSNRPPGLQSGMQDELNTAGPQQQQQLVLQRAQGQDRGAQQLQQQQQRAPSSQTGCNRIKQDRSSPVSQGNSTQASILCNSNSSYSNRGISSTATTASQYSATCRA